MRYDRRLAIFAEEIGMRGIVRHSTRLAIFGTGNVADGFCLCREWGVGGIQGAIVWERSASPGEDAIWFARRDVEPMIAALCLAIDEPAREASVG